jgi:hypothetical protein
MPVEAKARAASGVTSKSDLAMGKWSCINVSGFVVELLCSGP